MNIGAHPLLSVFACTITHVVIVLFGASQIVDVFKGMVQYSVFVFFNVASYECEAYVGDPNSLGFRIKKQL